MTTHKLKKLITLLHKVYEKHRNHDWDTWYCVAGDEGKGKSHFNLHVLTIWYMLLYKKVHAKHARHISLSKDLWKKDLSKLKKFEASVYDEGGELNNRRAMSRFNVDITQLARVIRGDNNLVILTIQDLFDLDPFFTKRRLRGLFYIPERGKYAFYSQKRLRLLIALNRPLYVKNYNLVQPTFRGTFSKYNGPLKEEYDKMKAEFLRASKKGLAGRKEDPRFEKYMKILRYQYEGHTDKEIGKFFGITAQSILKFRSSFTDHILSHGIED